MATIAEWIERGADKWPKKLALITKHRQVTYEELRNSTNAFARNCINSGLRVGDRVCIYANNSFETVVSIFGTIKAGGIFVCIHPQTPHSKVLEIMKDCDASIIISEEPFRTDLDLKVQITLNKDVEEDDSKDWIPFSHWLNDDNFIAMDHSSNIAALIYTSGSTGRPKGIISSHENIRFATEAINRYLKNDSSDRILSYLPLSFDYGLFQLFLAFSSGATLYLRDSKLFAAEINQILKKEMITGLPGLRSLFGFLSTTQQIEFPTVRYVTNTGDSLTKPLVEKIKHAFPSADVFLMYGLTECKRVSYLPPKHLETKMDSVGVPLEGTEVFILNDNLEKCKPFEHGELFVSGPHVCQGYWRRERETRETFIESNGQRLLKTGDIFYEDAEGFLYYVARKDNMFKSRGYRIEPQEIESTLTSHFEEIREMVVVGIPDEKIGSRIGYLLIPKEHGNNQLLMDKVKEFCKSNLEPWKQADLIHCSKTIPLTSSGKIDRKKIAELFFVH